MRLQRLRPDEYQQMPCASSTKQFDLPTDKYQSALDALMERYLALPIGRGRHLLREMRKHIGGNQSANQQEKG